MSITTADDLLRPTSQPPSHEEMSGVIVAASVQAEKDWQGAWTSTPPSMTEAEHYLTTRRAALEHAAKDIYLGAIEHASPDQRDSLLQNLHRQHITLTEWAAAQAAPILSQNDRTALRRDYRTLYGSPIITKAAVQWIARVTAGRPLLEIGAGNGYLASELQAQDVDIIASEPRSFGAEYRHRIPMSPTTCVNMLQATGKEAITLHPDRDILWSWPDNHVKYSHKTLAHFTGRFLVYIGEDQHGHTGSQKFHQILETDYTEIDSHQIPTFPGLHDRIILYERARHPQAGRTADWQAAI